ncbi:MAG: soluble aldose sugar dehydrogenase [Rhizobium sp.]|nr:soluble aldose sugar dehydrogenase [Rhizobium sp.]
MPLPVLKRKAAAAIILAGFATFSGTSAVAAQAQYFATQKVSIAVEPVAEGLESPWGVEVLPDGAFIVTEKPGRLRIIRDGKLSKPITGLPKVAANGQGGLLDVALSPKFVDDRTIFLTASLAYDGGAGTAVIRGKLSADERSLSDVRTIFRMKKIGTTERHFGSRIAFGTDGTLYFTIGDRGRMKRAQDFFDHAASILRINTDGSVPADNPFADGKRALPEIFSKGHRNAQGITFDPLTSAIVTAEHGDRGGDEINMPKPSLNYGWPVISYGVHYSGKKIGKGVSAPGFEQPAHYWDPSIAPGALTVYRGAMFPEWKDDILVTSLKFGLISRIARDENNKITGEERFIDGAFGRLRDIITAPDGSLLVLTDDDDGKLLRITRGTNPS